MVNNKFLILLLVLALIFLVLVEVNAQDIRLNKPLTDLGFTGLTNITFQARIATTSFCSAVKQGDPALDMGACFTTIAVRNCAEAGMAIRADYDVDDLAIDDFIAGCLGWIERDLPGLLAPSPNA